MTFDLKKINFKKIKKYVLRNWELKLISFVLAVIFWTYVIL